MKKYSKVGLCYMHEVLQSKTKLHAVANEMQKSSSPTKSTTDSPDLESEYFACGIPVCACPYLHYWPHLLASIK